MDAAADTQAPPSRSPRRWRRRLIRVASGVGVVLALTVGALALSVDESSLDPEYGGPAPLPPEVAARFAADLVEDRLDEVARSPAPTLRGRWRARRWASRVEVVIDYGHAWRTIETRRVPFQRRWRITVYPHAFWQGGVRERGDLDAAVAFQITSQIVGLLAVRSGFGRSLADRPSQALQEARYADDAAIFARLRTAAFWGLVLLASAGLIYAGLMEI